MNIQNLKDQGMIIFEVISGSKAYGLDTEASDTDIKGVFILPKAEFFGLNYYPQVSNSTNDIVYYELKRFFELLTKNNPNVLELLATPRRCILYQHPVFNDINPNIFLSKLCKTTFAGYAMLQIKKARGLHKKILNPMEKQRKNILDFCYIIKGQKTIPLLQWLKDNNFIQKKCGAIKLNHTHGIYAICYDDSFHGIMQKKDSNDIKCSSVPKNMEPIAIMSFNKDGYKKYCKDYNEYWNWVANRNEERYRDTIVHGKNYDAKNIMHTFRLLEIAENIAKTGSIIIEPQDRAYYLKIKSGYFDYKTLIKDAEIKIQQINILFEKSQLPEKPAIDLINKLLVKIRKTYYEDCL